MRGIRGKKWYILALSLISMGVVTALAANHRTYQIASRTAYSVDVMANSSEEVIRGVEAAVFITLRYINASCNVSVKVYVELVGVGGGVRRFDAGGLDCERLESSFMLGNAIVARKINIIMSFQNFADNSERVGVYVLEYRPEIAYPQLSLVALILTVVGLALLLRSWREESN